MPKAELHAHLDGSVRTSTILDLARARGAKLPAADAASLEPFVTVPPGCASLAEFLETFDLFYPLLRDPGAVERIAYELAVDAAADGVTVLEARFAPALQAAEGFGIEAVARAALKGLLAGAAETGMAAGLILCAYRSVPPEVNLETARVAARLLGEGVVGLDLAGDERNFPALPHVEAFALARKAGVPVTVHAGEEGPPSNVQEALFLLGAARLGHAVRLPEDPDLLDHVARSGIAVEVCLTSNLRTGRVPSLERHPLPLFLTRGIRAVLCTDDPAVFRTTLSGEYARAVEAFGLGREDVRRLARAGFEAAFLPAAERRRRAGDFERWFDARDRR
jgi:adenosine deaminase